MENDDEPNRPKALESRLCLLGLEEQDGAVSKVKVDEMLRFCGCISHGLPSKQLPRSNVP